MLHISDSFQFEIRMVWQGFILPALYLEHTIMVLILNNVFGMGCYNGHHVIIIDQRGGKFVGL